MTGRDVKVSVIVTTYNHERYIDRAIESVLDQVTDFDYEIVVGEDCSTDRTRDIVIDWQRKRPDRIRLVLQETNAGGYANFSAVYRAAKGDYVSWFEGDDYFTDPRRLQKMADFLDAHADCAICFHPLQVVYEGKPGRKKIISAKQILEIGTIKDLYRKNSLHPVGTMFRNRLIDDLPPWVYQLQEGDRPLFLLLARHGNIGKIDEIMGAYRVHAGGIWSRMSELDKLKSSIHTSEACRRNLGLSELDNTICDKSMAVFRIAARSGQLRVAAGHAGKVISIFCRRPDILFKVLWNGRANPGKWTFQRRVRRALRRLPGILRGRRR